jgi:hypothetical protein
MDPGGRRWQEFLSQPGEAYLEIQAGLAPTQGDYLAMPAGATWEWLEAYGLIETDPKPVHGPDWSAAFGAVEHELDRRLPQEWLDAELSRTAAMANRAPVEVLHHGSGWAALENIRRERAGQPPFASDALPFPLETIGEEQMPWLTLLNDCKLPSRQPSQGPGSLMVQPEWHELLEKSVREFQDPRWSSWYHLGVMRYRAGDVAGAKQAFVQSLHSDDSAWAYRDLAFLALEQGDASAAADLWLKASAIAPQMVPLAIECAKVLLQTRRFADLTKFADALPPEVRSTGRIRLLRAMSALEQGDLATVEKYFAGDVDIPNIREKETTLSDLWFRWQEQRVARERGVAVDDRLRQQVRREFPPPMRFDFRLTTLV